MNSNASNIFAKTTVKPYLLIDLIAYLICLFQFFFSLQFYSLLDIHRDRISTKSYWLTSNTWLNIENINDWIGFALFYVILYLFRQYWFAKFKQKFLNFFQRWCWFFFVLYLFVLENFQHDTSDSKNSNFFPSKKETTK